MIDDIVQLKLLVDGSVVRLDSSNGQNFKIAEVRHSMEGVRPEAIARLFAAAPDMLRMLMGMTITEGGHCPFCVSKTKKKGKFHADGCPYVEVLKKAGVTA